MRVTFIANHKHGYYKDEIYATYKVNAIVCYKLINIKLQNTTVYVGSWACGYRQNVD